MVYVVTYDLNKIKNYNLLYSTLLDLGECKRDPGLDSVWFISSSLDIDSFTDQILSSIDKDDRIFVSKLNYREYKGWLIQDVWDWIYSKV